jgi:hypothetical protein
MDTVDSRESACALGGTLYRRNFAGGAPLLRCQLTPAPNGLHYGGIGLVCQQQYCTSQIIIMKLS